MSNIRKTITKAISAKRLAALLLLFIYFLIPIPLPFPLSFIIPSPFLVLPANADPPVKFTYQGNIRQSGILVTGNKEMKFSIYSSSWSETALWSSPYYNVSVSTGVFRVILEPDTITQLQWNSEELWLEIEVENVKLSPRELITSSIYSINALLHSGKKYTTSQDPPESPNIGDLWFDTSVNRLKYYNSSAWTEPSGIPMGDNLGNHIATTTLNMNNFGIVEVADITANGYIMTTSTITVMGDSFSVGISTFSVKEGKVGIGTDSPTATLDVKGEQNPGDYIMVLKSGNKIAAWLRNK